MMKVKVPGTTANIGPGFDSLGIALNIYNNFSIEHSDETIVEWSDKSIEIPLEENYVYTTIIEVLKKHNFSNIKFKLTIGKCDIPFSGGLGSSASAIVGGIYCANYLMNDILSQNDIIDIASEIEGHPDNTSPAILGDMIISIKSEDRIIWSKVDFPSDLTFQVMVPSFSLSTKSSRKALPASYSLDDVKANIGSLGLLINSINTKDYSNLRVALKDKIHQPYRYPLIEDSSKITDFLETTSSLGFFISGGGPTLINIVRKEDALSSEIKIKDHLNNLKTTWEIFSLEINKRGTIIEVDE